MERMICIGKQQRKVHILALELREIIISRLQMEAEVIMEIRLMIQNRFITSAVRHREISSQN